MLDIEGGMVRQGSVDIVYIVIYTFFLVKTGGYMKAPKCRYCGKEHWSTCNTFGVPSLDIAKDKVRTISKKSILEPKKVRTIEEKVHTIRRVSLKEINRSASKNFNNLPFIVTKNGRDIARVEKV